VNNLAYIGAAVLTVITICMVFINRKRIVAEEKASKE
jgi:PTS system galactitol-specific IIC component